MTTTGSAAGAKGCELSLEPLARAGLRSLAEETAAIEAVRSRLAAAGAPLGALVAALQAVDALPAGSALAAACRDIAVGVDGGSLSAEVAFHHRGHFADVTLGAHVIGLHLGRDGRLDATLRAELLAAAVAHDIGHDGSANGDAPFRLERASIALARPFWQAAGVSDDTQARLAALILATDLRHGLPVARAWWRHHAQDAARPAWPDEPAFELFAETPALTWAAVALTEADALASAGLSVASAEQQEQRIAAEQGGKASAHGKVAYLDAVFPQGFLVATRFNPNLAAIRSAAQQQNAQD